MKSLLLITLMAFSLLAETPESEATEYQSLEMQILQDLQFEEMVKIYDYDGKLITEISLNQVVNDDIAAAEYALLNISDFAFNYCGDYYYFQSKRYTAIVN